MQSSHDPALPRLALMGWVLFCLPCLGSCSLVFPKPEPIQTLVRRTVAPGDLLRLSDLDRPGSKPVLLAVDSAGEVAPPGLGAALPVAGCTGEDVEAVLASFSEHPARIRVDILPPRSRYWLYGEVELGGRRALRPGTTLSQAVSSARPHAGQADLTRVHILRGRDDPREICIDLADPEQDIELQDGDVLVVPPTQAGGSPALGMLER